MRSHDTLASLEDFKTYVTTTFDNYCRNRYGNRVFEDHLLPRIEEMLENLEEDIEFVGEDEQE